MTRIVEVKSKVRGSTSGTAINNYRVVSVMPTLVGYSEGAGCPFLPFPSIAAYYTTFHTVQMGFTQKNIKEKLKVQKRLTVHRRTQGTTAIYKRYGLMPPRC